MPKGEILTGQIFARVWDDGSVDARLYLAKLDGTVVYRRLFPPWLPEPSQKFRQVSADVWGRYLESALLVTKKQLSTLWKSWKKLYKSGQRESLLMRKKWELADAEG